ncbi:MAG TPA: hypothetical protein VHW64_09270 [Nocardioides sp.]|jgi:hypothetical protein|uniref:hypothetical protein n=1 Tax=Nocardioides sp. TaxID=35761 RepID=UPI002E37CA41|nr:hypothetical protein [Nocardioides sp.]HEX3930882.1 hypothetical protein [Nocardioides sp.]
MSTTSWSIAPHTVHVNEDPAGAVARAQRDGALFFEWPLRGIRNLHELGASAHELFQVPYPSPTLSGMVDYASDLEWFESPQGVLLVVDAEGARAKVVLAAASTLPPIGDRWRAQGKPFEAFLRGVVDVAAVLGELERRNAHLDEFGRTSRFQPDTHRLAVSAPAGSGTLTDPRPHPILRWSRRGA